MVWRNLVPVCLLVLAMPAGAQNLRDVDGPKEVPPASFTGKQYVDSRGCIFVRAGIDGEVTWVPRVGRDRRLICGQEPTLTASAATASAPPAAAKQDVLPTAPTVGARPILAPVAAKPAAAVTKRRVVTKSRVTGQAAPAPAYALRVTATTMLPGGSPRCADPSAPAVRYSLDDGRKVLRCGPAVADPNRYVNGLNLPETGRTIAALPAVKAPPGFKPAWSDGRLNPARGLADSRAGSGGPAKGRPAGTMPAASASAYIQVGAFADPDNADRAASRIAALNLGVARNATSFSGRAGQIILAGPFASAAEAQAALHRLRGSGFTDAFVR